MAPLTKMESGFPVYCYNAGMDLTSILGRQIHPTKWLCRIRLCPRHRQLHDGLAEWHNENKKNHDTERIEGLFHIKECMDCGRTTVICTAWRVLNAIGG